eukprot:CAMPEP_0197541382 /NCGR_PEP_ID=MMETSP1318-20131121/67128_1 /TAXON_ID=552666 /ORGANISM="Partenskyella glossopodia, Strain RCC365" /LENGTH=234 /DNA_ID=CAMNT_0043100549 /DNA_START=1432 /DNA_END=2136 /DNA_ORIENTATION=+
MTKTLSSALLKLGISPRRSDLNRVISIHDVTEAHVKELIRQMGITWSSRFYAHWNRCVDDEMKHDKRLAMLIEEELDLKSLESAKIHSDTKIKDKNEAGQPRHSPGPKLMRKGKVNKNSDTSGNINRDSNCDQENSEPLNKSSCGVLSATQCGSCSTTFASNNMEIDGTNSNVNLDANANTGDDKSNTKQGELEYPDTEFLYDFEKNSDEENPYSCWNPKSLFRRIFGAKLCSE